MQAIHTMDEIDHVECVKIAVFGEIAFTSFFGIQRAIQRKWTTILYTMHIPLYHAKNRFEKAWVHLKDLPRKRSGGGLRGG